MCQSAHRIRILAARILQPPGLALVCASLPRPPDSGRNPRGTGGPETAILVEPRAFVHKRSPRGAPRAGSPNGARVLPSADRDRFGAEASNWQSCLLRLAKRCMSQRQMLLPRAEGIETAADRPGGCLDRRTQADEEERAVRRPRRRRRLLVPRRDAHRDLQDARRRAARLAQEHAGEVRRRPSEVEDPRAAALELRRPRGNR